jgi:hypothetical protein
MNCAFLFGANCMYLSAGDLCLHRGIGRFPAPENFNRDKTCLFSPAIIKDLDLPVDIV